MRSTKVWSLRKKVVWWVEEGVGGGGCWNDGGDGLVGFLVDSLIPFAVLDNLSEISRNEHERKIEK